MSGKNIVGGLVGKAAGAAKNPVGTAGQALGLAKGAVATGVTVAEGVAHVAADRLRARQGKGHSSPVQASPEQAEQAGEKAAEKAADVTESAASAAGSTADTAARTAKKAAKKTTRKAAKKAPSGRSGDSGGARGAGASDRAVPEPREPEVVLAEPAPPAEPPVDIVEQVLAREAEPAEGHATEPKAASRDESHGDAAMQRAEFDEIAEEQAEAFPPGDVAVETPVGTTGADTGRNPDTAEADLQQPQTEPLVDPSTTKTVKSEAETAKKASRTRKR